MANVKLTTGVVVVEVGGQRLELTPEEGKELRDLLLAAFPATITGREAMEMVRRELGLGHQSGTSGKETW